MMAGRQLWVAAVLLTSGLSAKTVDMKNTSLTNIPTKQNTDVTEFILNHNSIMMAICDIRALQKYPKLRVLDLSDNLIQTLPPRAFDTLTNLEVLNLKNNRLQSLPKDIFKGLSKLKTLLLEDNPWNCSCPLMTYIKYLYDSGISIGRNVSCYTPEKLAGKAVLNEESLCLIQPETKEASTVTTIKPASTSSSSMPTNSNYVNMSSKELTGGMSTGSNSWKFLLGVVVITLSISTLIVCAVKSPSWYKLLFNYRHQRLREDVEPNVINGARYSNFSLDTEQTETSIQELDGSMENELNLQPLEEDDGFIEDGYIEPGHYRDCTHDSQSLK